MTRVTADTNVFISALMFRGLPGIFQDLARQRSFTLVTSTPLLEELEEKLLGKFRVSPTDVAAIRAQLLQIAFLAEPNFVLEVVVEDPDDNRVLECAVAGKADFIVSGDRHLINLGSYDGIPILTVRQFMDRYSAPL